MGVEWKKLLFEVSEDETPQLSGPLEVLENSIQLDHALGTDHHWSGVTMLGTAGAALAFGELCYLDGEAANDKWELADSDAEATSGDVLLGICVLAAIEDAATELLLFGFVRDDSRYDFGSGGDALYVENGTDGSAGAVRATRPSGSGDIVRVVGHAHDDADTIFFNPSDAWLEV